MSRPDGSLAVPAALRAAVRLLPSLAVAPLDRVASFHAMRRAAARICDDLGIVARVEDRTGISPGELAEGGFLFVHLDQQTLLSVCLYPLVIPSPFALVVNVEFALLPVFGWMSVLQGAVPIVRQRPEQARRALARVAERLREGESFGMSIEGRRSPDGRLSPFKKGPAVLAIEAGAPLVPFMTHGEWPLWPGGSSRIRPGVVDLVAYPPIPTRGLSYADRGAVVEELRALAERERRARGNPHVP